MRPFYASSQIIFLISFIAQINAYAPKLVLFSFDGFRSDYLHKNLTPTMYELSKKGVQTQMMKSCFATKTFPNHFSIVTGLYEENHGIINNKMYDPITKTYFEQSNLDAEWWNDMDVDPIWNVNERFSKDHKSVSSMWPGSPISYRGQKPSYVEKYRTDMGFIEQMDQAIGWLTLEKDPANFVLVYIAQPDKKAHNHGPFSPEVREILKELDNAAKYFLKRLEEKDLTDETNIMIVSDHGMSEVRSERVIDLSDQCDSNDLIVSGVSPNLNLFLKDQANLDKIYGQLKDASLELPFSVYKTKEVPVEYHFRNHRRLGDIVIEAEDTFEVVLNPSNSSSFDEHTARVSRDIMKREIKKVENKEPINHLDIVAKFEDFKVRMHEVDDNGNKVNRWGEHGYNNSLMSMRPLFMAYGPAFRKQYIHKQPFENIDLYPLICSVLHLNLDPNFMPTDRYCTMDAKPSRIRKMLAPIKYTGNEDVSSSSPDNNGLNIFSILLLGVLSLVLLGCAFTLCTAAISNSKFNKRRKHKLHNIDLDEDVIDIDLSQYQRNDEQRTKKNYLLNEEEQGLIDRNDDLDYV